LALSLAENRLNPTIFAGFSVNHVPCAETLKIAEKEGFFGAQAAW
jgi:hypothetical protein